MLRGCLPCYVLGVRWKLRKPWTINPTFSYVVELPMLVVLVLTVASSSTSSTSFDSGFLLNVSCMAATKGMPHS